MTSSHSHPLPHLLIHFLFPSSSFASSSSFTSSVPFPLPHSLLLPQFLIHFHSSSFTSSVPRSLLLPQFLIDFLLLNSSFRHLPQFLSYFLFLSPTLALSSSDVLSARQSHILFFSASLTSFFLSPMLIAPQFLINSLYFSQLLQAFSSLLFL